MLTIACIMNFHFQCYSIKILFNHIIFKTYSFLVPTIESKQCAIIQYLKKIEQCDSSAADLNTILFHISNL